MMSVFKGTTDLVSWIFFQKIWVLQSLKFWAFVLRDTCTNRIQLNLGYETSLPGWRNVVLRLGSYPNLVTSQHPGVSHRMNTSLGAGSFLRRLFQGSWTYPFGGIKHYKWQFRGVSLITVFFLIFRAFKNRLPSTRTSQWIIPSISTYLYHLLNHQHCQHQSQTNDLSSLVELI